MRGAHRVEIISGVAAGDLVVLTRDIADGTPRAHARALDRAAAMRFEWTVALRFLREGGLQTLMIIAGATAGISVIVFITGFLGDIQADLIRRTLGVQPNIIVRPAEEVARPLRAGDDALPQVQARVQRLRSVDQWQPLRLRLENTPGVRAVSPVAAGPGLITRGDTNKSVTVTGIVPDRYAAVTRFNEKIVAGELRLNPGETIIGTDLARDLGVGVGDKVRLSTPTSPGDAYQIRGIYDLGQRSLNRAYAYVSLPAAQALLDLPGGISSLEIAIDDLFGAEGMAQQLQQTMPHEVESWMRANPQLRTALGNQTDHDAADPLFSRAGGGDRRGQRAGRHRGAENPRDRHPARDGRLARAHPARVPAAGRGDRPDRRLHRLHRRLCTDCAHEPLRARRRRRPVVPGAFQRPAVPGHAGRRLPARPRRRDHAGAARGAARSGAGDPHMSGAVIELAGIRKTYNEGTPVANEVLHGIGFAIAPGEFACLIGPSGSGKSTLLNLIGLLEKPSGGSYLLNGTPIQEADDDTRTRARLETLGFVFQFHHLLPAFSAIENVMLPGLMLHGAITPEVRATATRLLTAVGLADAHAQAAQPIVRRHAAAGGDRARAGAVAAAGAGRRADRQSRHARGRRRVRADARNQRGAWHARF